MSTRSATGGNLKPPLALLFAALGALLLYLYDAAPIPLKSIGLGELAAVALPRAVRALRVMGRPRPEGPPPGYAGWPLWNHRVCLSHNRLFGWAYIAGLGLGAAVPGFRL